MGECIRYLGPYKKTVAWGLVIKFIASVSELMLPLILDYLIDDVAAAYDPANGRATIIRIVIFGVIMLVFAAICIAGNIVANRLSAVSSGKMTHDLRYALFSKTSRLRSEQVDGFSMPSLISRLTSDTYYVNKTVAETMRLGVRAPILLIGGLILCFVIEPFLALVLLICLPIVTVAFVFITRRSIRLFNAVQKDGDGVVRSMQENITGVRVVKALSKSDYETGKFSGVNEKLRKNEYRANQMTLLTNPLATLILNLGLVGIIVVGMYRESSAGDLLAFLSLFTIILNSMLGFSKIFVTISRGIASGSRIRKVLDEDERQEVYADDGKEGATSCCRGDGRYKIEFRDVSFSYNGNEDNLEHITFGIKPGETIGVIGGTGSGKSTIINLLLRFYDAREGEVYVDGRDVRAYEPEALRKKFGVAFQNDFLYSGTVRDNIKYFRDIPDEDVQKASECAQADEFIGALDGGMDFVIGQKAMNLSGGQKQRVIIARALAASPEILVLDDSSSALDYATDARFRRALTREYPACTKFIVAQRVSAVKHADLIVVMDDGKMVGIGTHDELVETCEDYREIYSAQMGEKVA
ncbi:MAG: ABC transporter ATP-binding protein/permease [Clostridia bacterium]|nr:ABC transporter ATP-binding protein/permease [Clostridia bacterium]